MICQNCKHEISQDALFCPVCGTTTEQQLGEPPPLTPPQREDLPGAGGRVKKKAEKRKKSVGFCFLLCISFTITLAILGCGAGVMFYQYQQSISEYDTAELMRIVKEELEEEQEKEKRVQSAGEKEATEKIQETGAGEEESGIAVGDEDSDGQIVQTEEFGEVVHRYELISGNYTWTEAYEDALARGGRLAHFDSLDAYSHVISELQTAEDAQDIRLWIGGVRLASTREYYWANEDGSLGGDLLNGEVYRYLWQPGSPMYGQNQYYMILSRNPDTGIWGCLEEADQPLTGTDRLGYLCEFGY